MNRKKWAFTSLTCTVLTAALLCVGAARGQEGPPPAPDVMMRGGGPGGPGGPGPFGDRIELMGFEGLHGNKIVKGAPFSATASTETTQTLQDGTSIHRTTTSTLYRDSLGRSRNEVTLSGFGPLQASGKPHTMITIADPVAGSRYMLDAENKIAHQMVMRGHGAPSPEQEAAFEQKMQARLQKEEASGAVKKDSLGTQTINGVAAEGTRITHTIAAGQIGNDKAIQIVFERWFSPDLQVVVKSARSDPRFGTTTYTLTNVQRTEPAAALFAVPSDYTVQQGGPRNHGRGALHAPPPDAPAPQ
jgi:hypothetical protein